MNFIELIHSVRNLPFMLAPVFSFIIYGFSAQSIKSETEEETEPEPNNSPRKEPKRMETPNLFIFYCKKS